MREIQTFFSGTRRTFWLDGDEDLYLYKPGEEKKGGFFLMKYDSFKDADKIYKNLRNHPNCPRVLPLFTIEGEQGCYMALKKHGQSLENFLKGNDKKFSSNGQITNFYQHILIDLLLVVDHCIRSEIECILNLSSIYVVDEPTPHLTLTKFKSRDGKVSNDVWKNAGVIVKDINKSICGAAYLNGEMRSLLKTLDEPNKVSLARISHLPLFWSSEQRRWFICDMWDKYKNSNHAVFSNNFQPFGRDLKAVLSILESDVRLSNLIKEVDNTATADANVPEQASRLSNLIKEVDKYPATAKVLDQASRHVLYVVRSCLSHFREMKARITGNGVNVDFNHEEELVKYFDVLFKDYVLELHRFAVFLEDNNSAQHLVPRNKTLSTLFYDES